MSVDADVREPDQLVGITSPEQQRAVVGHARALAQMQALLAERRLPGGILIHGPLGLGKATFAFHLTRQIFAVTGDEPAEQVFHQVAAGGHPNLLVLRRAARDSGKGFFTDIRVGDVRDAVERLHKTRGRAGHRVVLIDAIDDCNASSANALLKILEEPPAETTFLLVSHRPGLLLPTIRSRCYMLALRPLADADVLSVLQSAMPDASAADLGRAVRLAGGRPRRGLEALLLGDAETLTGLALWLRDPLVSTRVHLSLADALAANKDGAEARLARDLLTDWIAAEAKVAAGAARHRLASANELWDKAIQSFAEAETLNLDARQTLVAIFDAIRKHAQQHLSVAEPT